MPTTIIKNEYKCNVCNKIHLHEHSAELCEKRHKCLHENVKLVLYLDENYGVPKCIIKTVCVDCRKEFQHNRKEFDDCYDNQGVLRILYDSI